LLFGESRHVMLLQGLVELRQQAVGQAGITGFAEPGKKFAQADGCVGLADMAE